MSLEQIEQDLREIQLEHDALSEESSKCLNEIFTILGANDDEYTRPAGFVSDVERVRELLKAPGVHPNIRTRAYGETMLWCAVNDCDYDMVKVFLEAGADPNLANMMDSETALDKLYEPDADWEDDPESIIKLLEEHGAKRSNSMAGQAEELSEYNKKLLWAIGEDPDEVARIMNNDLLGGVFMQQLERKMEWAKTLSPEILDHRVDCKKRMKVVHRAYEMIPEESKQLMDECFDILEITDDEELKLGSAENTVNRVRDILNSGKEGIDVNLRSYETGDSLLLKVVTNYILEEEDDEAYVALVRFVVEKGADVNLEDIVQETPSDYLDHTFQYEGLTQAQKDIINLLNSKGAKILVRDENGVRTGVRGEGISQHEQERLKMAT
jgi:ankyrin repeat protein